MAKYTLQEVAQKIHATVTGDQHAVVDSCATLEDAGPTQLSLMTNRRYADRLAETQAAAVIVGPTDVERGRGKNLLVASDPYFAFQQAMTLLHPSDRAAPAGVHPLASVDPEAELGDGVTVQAFAWVGPNARVGRGTVIGAHASVGNDAVIGDDCVLHAGVCIYDRCVVGDRVTLHAHTVIGQDGMGYASSQAPGEASVRHHKIPQAGNVVIGDDVEMGAHCAVDRAALGSTVVGEGTKCSNHVVIGHGAKIGRHNLLVAFVGIAGSTTTGDYVVMGGQVGVAGHLTIGSQVQIAASAKVMHDIPDQGGQWGGVPALPFSQTKRIVLQQQKLPDLAAKVKSLEKRIRELEQRTPGPATAEVEPGR